MVPPCSGKISRVSPYSRPLGSYVNTGLSPSMVCLSRHFITLLLRSAFARRYLRSRNCFPFLQLLRCFSSLRSLLHPIHSGAGNPCGLGCPIRRSQDRSLVTSSPGLIAGSYVLHRLSTPRHPPCALPSLATPTGFRFAPKRETRPALRLLISNFETKLKHSR